ncbi:MAG: trehalase family glycosidase [Verrucomicrobiota bacterium]
MKINLRDGSFSSFGSFVTLQYLPESWNRPGLILRSVRNSENIREVFVVKLVRENIELPSEATADPVKLDLSAVDGTATAEFTFASPDHLHFKVQGADLVFEAVEGQKQVGFKLPDGDFVANVPSCSTQFLFTQVQGILEPEWFHQVRTQDKRRKESLPDGAWVTVRCKALKGHAEGIMEAYETSANRISLGMTFDQAASCAQERWEEWVSKTPEVLETYEEAAHLAMYVNFSSGIRPTSLTAIRRPTILMSKNWMTKCWSWDHCFNAVALSYQQPDLAWDQWMTLFDHQSDDGALPDFVSADGVGLNFCKPPIHGWALGRMMEQPGLLDRARTEEALHVLIKWTDWWFQHRDSDGDGIPEYHHGNDSGWDNGTVFDEGFPVASPDLPAFLAVQCETIAKLSESLEYKGQSRYYRKYAQLIVDRMVSTLWNGEQFKARLAGAKDHLETGDSMLPFMALIAGELLDLPYREQMVKRFSKAGQFLSTCGVSTENMQSSLYIEDGYWRGPVWPSSTVLIAEALLKSGYKKIASSIAKAYCDNCRQTMCFAENYNAENGTPLRDRAYTWGSSAFLFFAHAYLNDPKFTEADQEKSELVLN